jgi:hypothetical protein
MVDFNTGAISFHHLRKKPDWVAPSAKLSINNTRLALEAFLDSVRTRKPPVANVEHGRDAVLACLLVRESVYKRAELKMSEIQR